MVFLYNLNIWRTLLILVNYAKLLWDAAYYSVLYISLLQGIFAILNTNKLLFNTLEAQLSLNIWFRAHGNYSWESDVVHSGLKALFNILHFKEGSLPCCIRYDKRQINSQGNFCIVECASKIIIYISCHITLVSSLILKGMLEEML